MAIDVFLLQAARIRFFPHCASEEGNKTAFFPRDFRKRPHFSKHKGRHVYSRTQPLRPEQTLYDQAQHPCPCEMQMKGAYRG